jgi:hypothetical protein
MQPDLRLVHDSGVKSEMCFASASLRPQPDPEDLWWAFVAAQERSKRTLALNDGIAAGKAYAAFLMAYTGPATKGAA